MKNARLCLGIWLFFFCVQNLFSYTSTEVFQKHLNPIFIETGSADGSGIQKALAAGFSEIYSIELLPNWYEHCCLIFENQPNVHLFLGNSTTGLKKILSKVKKRATFWLDAHFCGQNSAIGDTHSPILEELQAISTHPIKDHTILIDDVRLFGQPEFDFISLEEVISALRKINPNYQIFFEDGFIKNDVLVAKIL